MYFVYYLMIDVCRVRLLELHFPFFVSLMWGMLPYVWWYPIAFWREVLGGYVFYKVYSFVTTNLKTEKEKGLTVFS